MSKDEENEIIELITGFVVECRGKGHFLPYTDHEVIRNWVEQAPDTPTLLGILNELLPEFYSKYKEKHIPPQLTGVNKKVLARLRDVSIFKA